MNERLNIRRMQVPEKSEAEEMPFDPMRDITAADWNDIVKSYDSAEGTLHDSIMLRSCAQFLNPSLSIVFRDLDDEEWRIVGHDLITFRERKNWTSFFESRMFIRQIDLARAPTITHEEHQKARHELLRLCNIEHWSSAATLAQALKLNSYSPEKERLVSPHMDGMRTTAENLKGGAPGDFAHIAATIKILDPAREIPLSQADWHKLKQSLDNLRQNKDWPTFCKFARDLYILAGDIEVSDAHAVQTLTVHPRKKGRGKAALSEQTRPMPESPSLPQ